MPGLYVGTPCLLLLPLLRLLPPQTHTCSSSLPSPSFTAEGKYNESTIYEARPHHGGRKNDTERQQDAGPSHHAGPHNATEIPETPGGADDGSVLVVPLPLNPTTTSTSTNSTNSTATATPDDNPSASDLSANGTVV